MPSVKSKLRVDLSPLSRFRGQTVADMKGISNGPIADAIGKRWAYRYLAFARKEYRQNAAGGRDWAPLSATTLAKDKALKRKRKGIMRLSDGLYNALIPGNPGNTVKQIRGGVRIGIAGTEKHPESKLSYGDLAAVLSRGGGALPSRSVLKPPDDTTKKGMQNDIKLGFRDVERGFQTGLVNANRRFTRG